MTEKRNSNVMTAYAALLTVAGGLLAYDLENRQAPAVPDLTGPYISRAVGRPAPDNAMTAALRRELQIAADLKQAAIGEPTPVR